MSIEKRYAIKAFHFDKLEVVTHCGGCDADIELRSLGEGSGYYFPFSNDEMQQIVAIWFKSLPEAEQAKRMIQLLIELGEDAEKENSES